MRSKIASAIRLSIRSFCTISPRSPHSFAALLAHFLLRCNQIEKLLKMTKFNTEEAATRFANKLRKYGVDEELRKLGAIEGETVRILDFEFEYRD